MSNSGFAVGEKQSLPQGVLEGGAMPWLNMGHTAYKCGEIDWFPGYSWDTKMGLSLPPVVG